jgi:hypothetical protein
MGGAIGGSSETIRAIIRTGQLEMAAREEIEEHLKLAGEQQPGSREIADARASLEAGDLHRAVELILKAPRPARATRRWVRP